MLDRRVWKGNHDQTPKMLRVTLLVALASGASAFVPSTGSFTPSSRLGRAPIAGNLRSAGRVSASSGASGLTMGEMNKYSKTITQKKSQGASQVRPPSHPKPKAPLGLEKSRDPLATLCGPPFWIIRVYGALSSRTRLAPHPA